MINFESSSIYFMAYLFHYNLYISQVDYSKKAAAAAARCSVRGGRVIDGETWRATFDGLSAMWKVI